MSIPGRTRLLLALLLSLPTGCVQIEVTVEMLDEGGARITERVRFSEALLDLDKTTAADRHLSRLLTREAVEERVKYMGKGAHLVTHQVADLPGGHRESVAVFEIPDIEDLRLLNPYVHEAPPGRLMRLQFSPIYRVVHSFHALGEMMLALVPAEAPRRGGPSGAAPPPPPAPVDLQSLRDLRPAFADMIEDFEVKLRLVATKPISYGYVRGRRENSKTIDLISFTGKDLDQYGQRFLDNEELMLSLLRWDLNADNLADTASGFAENPTLPVLRGKKPYGVQTFRVKPTKGLFRKYFAGRPKSQGGDVDDKPGGNPP